jgi:AbrB family looped-hinge helix DNA binding protein
MHTSRLSSKGQVIIPKAIRDAHSLDSGVVLAFEDHSDHIVIRVVPAVPRTTVDDLIGILRWDGPPKSIEDMEAGIARGARARR